MESMHITRNQLEHRFAFHPADTEQKVKAHETVREVLLEAADDIVQLTGAPTREQSLAITKLEEAMYWANAAIARNG